MPRCYSYSTGLDVIVDAFDFYLRVYLTLLSIEPTFYTTLMLDSFDHFALFVIELSIERCRYFVNVFNSWLNKNELILNL